MKSRSSPYQTRQISEAEKFIFGTKVRLRPFDTQSSEQLLTLELRVSDRRGFSTSVRLSGLVPEMSGILDTIHGKLYGAGTPFLIDEKLLRQLKFIRRGQFSDGEGAPALRVLGDVQSIKGIEKEKPVPTGIHADDLITAFLAQRPLDEIGGSKLSEGGHVSEHAVPADPLPRQSFRVVSIGGPGPYQDKPVVADGPKEKSH